MESTRKIQIDLYSLILIMILWIASLLAVSVITTSLSAGKFIDAEAGSAGPTSPVQKVPEIIIPTLSPKDIPSKPKTESETMPRYEITQVGSNPAWEVTPSDEDFSFATIKLTTSSGYSCANPTFTVNFIDKTIGTYHTTTVTSERVPPNTDVVITAYAPFLPSNKFADTVEIIDARCGD